MLVFQDPRTALHDTGPGHPERPERLEAVQRALDALGLTPVAPDRYAWGDDAKVLDAARRVHSAHYVRRLEHACRSGARYIDAIDSAISRGSFDAALGAAACTLAAVDAVMRGDAAIAFSAMRPPGHHCERDRSMGFCLLNNAAVAAQHLIDAHGLSRIAIVDFDVHHGNGTQHIFEDRADVFYVSTHQHPSTLYPGTGYEWEVGTRGTPGYGYTLNIPLPPGSGHREALAAFDDRILPRLGEYRPEFLLVSAGFDTDRRDPLASLAWTTATFHDVSRRLARVSANCDCGRIVSILEGGYDTVALTEGVEAHLAAIRDELAAPLSRDNDRAASGGSATGDNGVDGRA